MWFFVYCCLVAFLDHIKTRLELECRFLIISFLFLFSRHNSVSNQIKNHINIVYVHIKDVTITLLNCHGRSFSPSLIRFLHQKKLAVTKIRTAFVSIYFRVFFVSFQIHLKFQLIINLKHTFNINCLEQWKQIESKHTYTHTHRKKCCHLFSNAEKKKNIPPMAMKQKKYEFIVL